MSDSEKKVADRIALNAAFDAVEPAAAVHWCLSEMATVHCRWS